MKRKIHNNYDPSVIDEITRQPIHQGYNHLPKDEEIQIAALKLKNKAPRESRMMAQVLKSLLECQEIFNMLKDIVLEFWITDVVPEEYFS